ncbi:DDE-type integrase/transposase/recombinase [Dyadobacter sp. BHUBP1]|uniref:DDE-type integrase/transposase/recombinase n=1 Tax=Dyadobacter sp. BHUBP1 TaxID=3424178 RepID=UPI003D334453
MDFVSDALVNKRKIRALTIIDDCSREVLAAHADFSLPAQKVIDVLELIALARPYPEQIRVDNGPEFLADKFRKWCEDKNIAIHYIQPGKPMQNGRGGGPLCGTIESHLPRRCLRCLFI